VPESLTKGERRVVELVARGWTNQEVADQLNLRPKTVEWTWTKPIGSSRCGRARNSRSSSPAPDAPSKPGIPRDADDEADHAPPPNG